eukprot:COSAG01_NODE_1139_length_11544_cov_249.103801_4_plen_325_part_00
MIQAASAVGRVGPLRAAGSRQSSSSINSHRGNKPGPPGAPPLPPLPKHAPMHIATTTIVCAAALVLTAVAPSAPPLPPKPAHGDAPEPADSGKPKLTGDPKWLTRLHTRPGHTKQLTKDNFDEWVTDAVNGKKSAIVRWISTDDTSDCSWIIQRHGSSGDQALGGDKPPKEDYCKIMAKSSQQWNEVAEKYKDDSTVVFGDVVLSDWKDLVEDVKKVRTDLMKPMEEHDEEVHTMPEQPAHLSTIFANEVTELDYMYAEHIEEHIAEHIEEQPESGEEPENDDKDQMPTYAKHNFGCTIRVYDMFGPHTTQSRCHLLRCGSSTY